MRGAFDRHALRVVEAAYRVADDVEGWIAGVLEATRPLLDRGGGLQGYAYTIARSSEVLPCSRAVETTGTPDGFSAASIANCGRVPPRLVPELYSRVPPIATARATLSGYEFREHSDYRPIDDIRGSGVRDVIGVVAYDPRGWGLMMTAPANRRLPPFGRRDLDRWRMVRAHLLTGLRLQRALGQRTPPDAIIDPSGRVVHAINAARGTRARDVLRRRAVEIDRARTARRDPALALAMWTSLVDGTWSLLETFDRDGRSYWIARRNDPRPTIPRTLSMRERQVLAFAALGYANKQIAYTLGLAASTVSSHLRSGMRRLGIADPGALSRIPLERPREPQS